MSDKNLMHYVVVTGILINNEGKFLITKRADWEKAFPGRWTVPGGKLKVLDYVLKEKDTKEHWYNVFEDVLKREVKEEVGLDVEPVKLLLVQEAIYPADYIKHEHYIFLDYLCRTNSSEVKLDGKEIQEYVWTSLSSAFQLDLESFTPWDRRSIQMCK